MKEAFNHKWGLVSFIGIVCVVMGHTGCKLLELDGWFPYYSFHIPLFVVVSGYFYKEEEEGRCGFYLKKKVKRLLFPFYMNHLIYLVFQTIFLHFGYSIGLSISLYNFLIYPWTHDQPIGFNVSSWFIIALFLVNLFNLFFRKLLFLSNDKIKELILQVLYLVFSVAAVWYNNRYGSTGSGLVLLRSVFLLPFFQLGHVYREYLEAHDKINNILYFGFVFLVQGYIRYKYGYISYGVYNLSGIGINIWIIYITAVLGIAFWVRISDIFEEIFRKSGWMVYISRHTNVIMMHHIFAIYILQTFLAFIHSHSGMFSGFNMEEYTGWVYYMYAPHDVVRLFYVVWGVGMVMLFQHWGERIIKRFGMKAL